MNLKNKATTITTSLRSLGFWETSRSTLAHVLRDAGYFYRPTTDRAFDTRFGTDTDSVVRHDDLDIPDTVAKKTAHFYVSVPERFERYIIDALDIDFGDYNFVDVGCGKGRILLIASEFPFRAISGVELSPSLVDIARNNLHIFKSPTQKCSDFQVHCADARNFPMAVENTVFHFFHPFHPNILTQVLGNIAPRFQRAAKKAWVIYVWDEVLSLSPLFEEHGFKMVRYEKTAHWRWRYALYELM